MLPFRQQASQPKNPAWYLSGRWCGITALRIASGATWLTPFECDPCDTSESHRSFWGITLAGHLKNLSQKQTNQMLNCNFCARLKRQTLQCMFPEDHTRSPEAIHWDGICFPVMSTASRELHLPRALVYDRLKTLKMDVKTVVTWLGFLKVYYSLQGWICNKTRAFS